MTEADRSTLEKVQKFIADKNAKDGGWTWPGSPPITEHDLAEFASSMTAELQKENVRLREALEAIAIVDQMYTVGDIRTYARAALSKEKAK